MPLTIKGQAYYQTKEVCQAAGIARSTLMRWIADSSIQDASLRNRKGWRLFTEADLNRVLSEAQKTIEPLSHNLEKSAQGT